MLEEDFINYSQNILRLNRELLFIIVPPENCEFEQDFEFPNLGLKLSTNKKLQIIKIDDGNSSIFKYLNSTEMDNLIIQGYHNYRSSLDRISKNLELIKFYLKENNLLDEVELIISGLGSTLELLGKDDRHQIFHSSIWDTPDIRKIIDLVKTDISNRKYKNIAYKKLMKLKESISDLCRENDIEIVGDEVKVGFPDPNYTDLKIYQYFETRDLL